MLTWRANLPLPDKEIHSTASRHSQPDNLMSSNGATLWAKNGICQLLLADKMEIQADAPHAPVALLHSPLNC